ncbi:MAG: protein-L-isoaspartate(D-aspartate) O-methyltransferase [Pirellulales bacterium]
MSFFVAGAVLAGCFAKPAQAQSRPQFADARQRMIEEEIVAAGVRDPRVIESMRETLRHEFVPVSQRANAYYDMALPIGEGQTISPPFIVAYMTEQLDPQPADTVLEIGTGSGYQAAVLSPLVRTVYSIEIVKPLGERASRTLKRLKYDNVFTKVGDGYQGWPEHAPFDKIIVTCSPENVPQALVEQLKEGGRMIIPLGERYQQTLYLFRKQDGKLVSEVLLPTLFVPMTGAAEERRQVQPDPLKPAIYNGSFEELSDEGEQAHPLGWHYIRQMQRVEAADAPQGTSYVTFDNQVPGRGSQALQAFAVDGRQVRQLDVSLYVRIQGVRPGQSIQQLPLLGITFYDERRSVVGRQIIGPWRGSFEWRREREVLPVPPRAREAILRIGLLGAVGQLSLDAIELEAAKD